MEGYEPSPVTTANFNMPGLMVKYYDLNCTLLPTPVTVLPYKVTMITDINFPSNKDGFILTSGRTDYVYAEITGQVACPVSGNYTFYLISSDGSALYVNGTRLINNDGKQGMYQVYSGKTLAAGTYDLKVVYFNTSGTTTGLGGLQLKWLISDMLQPASRPMNSTAPTRIRTDCQTSGNCTNTRISTIPVARMRIPTDGLTRRNSTCI